MPKTMLANKQPIRAIIYAMSIPINPLERDMMKGLGREDNTSNAYTHTYK